MERRLSTIVAADVPGYSARMGSDEGETIRSLAALTGLLEEKIGAHGGRVFSRAGDGFLSEFPSPVSAVRAAHEIQQNLASPEIARDIGLELRIGIHLADVVVDGDDLLGDGVNIASRIETAADPGSILISSTVFDQVKRTAQLKFEYQGEKRFKNISDPVNVYSLIGDLGTHSCATAFIDVDSIPANGAEQIQPNSVVVVPFKNLSSDPDQEYFSDGITDEIITALSRFPDIFTISRNASFGLKGKTVNIRDIGKALGVQYCLEGGIRKLGNRVRINSFLVDSASGEQLWTEKIDCGLEDLFDVQDDLVAKIVSSVVGQIERQLEASAKRRRPNDLQAYECVLRGLEFHRLGGVTEENAKEALGWFDKAVERDPTYGRAHAWRACALATVAEWTGEDVWDELVETGRRAVELNETDAESHRIAGSLALYAKEFDQALYHFNRAVELNPNHAFLVGRTGEIYNFLGDGKTALEYQQRAKKLDPFLPEYCRELEAVAYYVLGDFHDCYRVVCEFARPSRRAAAYRAAASVHLDSPEKTRQAVNILFAIDRKFDAEQFILTEFFKDDALADQLRADLEHAIASVDFKMAG